MFCRFTFAVLFVLSVLGCETVAARDLSRGLPTEVEALRGDLLEVDCWDFSRQGLLSQGGHTVVCNYGDSLLTETIEGRRNWYGLLNDTIYYLGEEDRLTVIDADSAAAVAHKTADRLSGLGDVSFTASGMGGGRRFRIAESVTVSFSSAARNGTLIIAPQDTLYNVQAIRERRAFTATFPDDSAAATVSALIETYRWYDNSGAQSLLPVAVQRSVYDSNCGVITTNDAQPSFSMAYLPDLSEFSPEDNENKTPAHRDELPDLEAVADALSSAEVRCDGRTVTVGVEMPVAGLTVTVDIVDAGGHLYLHKSTVTTGSLDEITLDCSSLRTGEYIAVTGVENLEVAPEKRLIIIR